MSVIFSKVKLSVDGENVKFIVSGIPVGYDDLVGWTVFDDFLERIKVDSEIDVHVEAYKYGEGESYIATPYEVADFQNRLNFRPHFLESSCEYIGNIDFSFSWTSPSSFH